MLPTHDYPTAHTHACVHARARAHTYVNAAVFHEEIGYRVHRQANQRGGVEEVEEYPRQGEEDGENEERAGRLPALARRVVHVAAAPS